MSTYQFNTANTEGINFNQTWTVYDATAATSSTNTPDNPGNYPTPGTTVKGTGDSDWVVIKASAAIGAGDMCMIDPTTFSAAGITSTTAKLGNQVGVAPVAIASGSYGYIQRAGYATPTGLKVLDACAPNVSLATTTTAGTLDDITTTGKTISGVVITATNNAGSAATVVAMLNYPIVGATL